LRRDSKKLTVNSPNFFPIPHFSFHFRVQQFRRQGCCCFTFNYVEQQVWQLDTPCLCFRCFTPTYLIFLGAFPRFSAFLPALFSPLSLLCDLWAAGKLWPRSLKWRRATFGISISPFNGCFRLCKPISS